MEEDQHYPHQHYYQAVTSSPAPLPDTIDKTPALSQSERTVVAALLGIVAILGFTGNLLVILSILLSRRLRTTYNVLVFNLALTDAIVCFFIPWDMVALILGQWPLPGWICSLSGSIYLGGAGVSGYTLAFIAVNRYSLLTGHMKFLRHNIKLTMSGMVTITWCVPVIVIAIPLLTTFGDIGYDYKYSMCIWVTSNPFSTEFNIVMSVMFGVLTSVITLTCYVKMFLFIRNHTRKIQSHDNKDISLMKYGTDSQKASNQNTSLKRIVSQRQIQVTVNMFIVVCSFFICYTPALILLMVQDPTGRLLTYAGLILLCNSCVNPIIYTKNPEFRKTMVRIIQCKLPV